jgi:FemAB-related protein (PEP-CTERM system-associated)
MKHMVLRPPSPSTIVEAELNDRQVVTRVESWLHLRRDSTPFHRPAWINAVAKGTGQQARLLLALDEAGAIQGLLPLNLIHSPLFGRALVSSGFAVDGGILADDPSVAVALAAAMSSRAARWACPTLELRGGAAPGEGWTCKGDTYLGFSRALEGDDEAELLAIPRKHRAEVRKGLENAFDIRIGQGRALRDAHYALYCRSVHNLGTPVFPQSLFDAVLDAFGDKAEILLVEKKGVALAATLSLIHGESYMPYWQGALPAARQARANEISYFEAMRRARALGLKNFDFGRSKAGTGPAAYKKNWGFEAVPLAYHVRTLDGSAPRDINPLSPRYQRKIALWKALPAVVADRIGPWIARGLG